MTTTTFLVSELAARLNVSAGDILESAMRAGIETFWIEGQDFCLARPEAKAMFFKLFRLHGSVFAVEFEATEQQAESMALEFEVEVEDFLGVRS